MSEYTVPSWVKQGYLFAVVVVGLVAVWLTSSTGLGTVVSAISLTAAIGVLIPVAVDKWLWFLPRVRRLLRLPDLRGRWEGWIKNDLNNTADPFAIEIKQSGANVDVEIFSGAKTKAIGNSPGTLLMRDDHNNIALIVPLLVQTQDSTDPDGMHKATHWYDLTTSGKELRGEYINGRKRRDGTRGATGRIVLRWASYECIDKIGEPEKAWAMAIPDGWARGASDT